MGRSQRHKVYIQGFASDDSVVAEGLTAGTEGANNPPEALMEKPQPNQGQSIDPPEIGGEGGGDGGAGTPDPLSIVSLTPNTGVHGTGNLTVTIAGTGFTANSKAVLGVVDLATTFVSDTSLTCVIAMSGLLAGTQQVKVRRGLTNSNQLPFTVT